MAQQYDMVIRNGMVADGLGGDLFQSDIGIIDDRIAALARNLPAGKEEIDAEGLLVAPGFIDIHTHYDGQATWEDRLAPSSNHGVTTVVMGNCGVGFAPCRPCDRDGLVSLMAGVEDIPEVVMTEGLSWAWESFPQFLDAVAARRHDADIAAMLPHSALRVYAMGQRAVDREAATEEDIAFMAALTVEAMQAGAIGFATSRAIHHRSTRGDPIPTVRAAEAELRGILSAMAETGHGVFQLLSDFELFEDVDREFAMLRRLVSQTGRPMSFTVNQKHGNPEGWRTLMRLTGEASDAGVPIRAQVLGRPTGLLLGHEISVNPFSLCPAYQALSTLSFPERIEAMRQPQTRHAILNEHQATASKENWQNRFEMTDPPNYEPAPSESLAARADREGVTPAMIAYQIMLQDEGRRMLFEAAQNYAEGSLQAAYEMMTHKDALLGLGDGGAHYGLICDASFPTTMLTHWTRDRVRGPKLPLPATIRALTSRNADAVGLRDRGRLVAGFKADINLIDYDRLQLRPPHVLHDLPTGGRRIVQAATGYVATITSGVVTYRGGLPTGALPGRLVRGPRPAPSPN